MQICHCRPGFQMTCADSRDRILLISLSPLSICCICIFYGSYPFCAARRETWELTAKLGYCEVSKMESQVQQPSLVTGPLSVSDPGLGGSNDVRNRKRERKNSNGTLSYFYDYDTIFCLAKFEPAWTDDLQLTSFVYLHILAPGPWFTWSSEPGSQI